MGYNSELSEHGRFGTNTCDVSEHSSRSVLVWGKVFSLCLVWGRSISFGVKCLVWGRSSVRCTEVVPVSEGSSTEVALHIDSDSMSEKKTLRI